jgi:hypothetical protein
MMKSAGVVAPTLWKLGLDVLTQSPMKFETKLSVHHLCWWNKFLTHDAFNNLTLFEHRSELVLTSVAGI